MNPRQLLIRFHQRASRDTPYARKTSGSLSLLVNCPALCHCESRLNYFDFRSCTADDLATRAGASVFKLVRGARAIVTGIRNNTSQVNGSSVDSWLFIVFPIMRYSHCCRCSGNAGFICIANGEGIDPALFVRAIAG